MNTPAWMAMMLAALGAAPSGASRDAVLSAREQPPVPTSMAPDLSEIPVHGLAARLSALDPASPEPYFRLAEELAEERFAPGARDLARRLYVLAFDLDRRSAAPAGIAYSACLGLAALANTQPERRWLRAIAMQVDTRAGEAADQARRAVQPAVPVTERAALEITSALGHLRAGEGRRALALLNRPGNWDILREYEGVLGVGLDAGRIRRLAEEWPACPECHNRRVVGGRGSQPAQLCPACGGAPGPKLSPQELVGQLRLEVSLLRGIHKLWSSQILADGGEPLRDPNPDDLAITLHIDTGATLWRDGRWQAAPKPSPPPELPAQPPDPVPDPETGGG